MKDNIKQKSESKDQASPTNLTKQVSIKQAVIHRTKVRSDFYYIFKNFITKIKSKNLVKNKRYYLISSMDYFFNN